MSTPNDQESLCDKYKELISSLPREKGWFADIYKYEGHWYAAQHLQALISAQENFHVQDSDVFVATHPKSGTTWLKAIVFTLLNRERHRITDTNHPLLSHNPHDVVHFLEHPYDIADENTTPRRLFSTHVPYASLPESIQNSSTCKLVYMSRNPKDTFVSFWHFSNTLRSTESAIKEMFEKFCKGVSPYGPVWDHVLGYWEQSKLNPERVFFLKYEEMKEKPELLLRRLAKFLNCPFTEEEEEFGMVEKILKFCNFEHLSNLDVNKNGRREYVAQDNSLFFRKGEVGDYKNHLSTEMVEKLDGITREKLLGSGLFLWDCVSIGRFEIKEFENKWSQEFVDFRSCSCICCLDLI